MQRFEEPRGLTLTETIASLAGSIVLLAVIAPVLGQFQSTSNGFDARADLRVLHQAHECYARDWSDRQLTSIPDDFGEAGGNASTYEQTGPIPDFYLGYGCNYNGLWRLTGAFENARDAIPLALSGSEGHGSFRFSNISPFNEYVNGRFYDPTFYSPLEAHYDDVYPNLVNDCEFNIDADCVYLPSYVNSPAAMYHPEVFRSPSKGGFRDPGSFDEGFASPTVSQVLFPHLKTRMIQHHWLELPPAPEHPEYVDPVPLALTKNCAASRPYLFNHGKAARTPTLFFDGSIVRLSAGAVQLDDARVRKGSGGVDGLWSRDTPLGEDGYWSELAHDDTRVNHHILTSDGIRGRDTLADQKGCDQ